MPRNRMLTQIDDELVHAKRWLAFWRDQKAFLAETALHQYAIRLVQLREAEVKELVEIQEALTRMDDA